MTSRALSHEQLVSILLDLPPLKLQGVELLREFRATGVMPTDQEQLAAATKQLMQYTQACEKVGAQLKTLAPVPAQDDALVGGFPL